jgi:RecB family endonuclease NucS
MQWWGIATLKRNAANLKATKKLKRYLKSVSKHLNHYFKSAIAF